MSERKLDLLSKCTNAITSGSANNKTLEQTVSHFASYIDKKLKKFDNRTRAIVEKRISDVIFDLEFRSVETSCASAADKGPASVTTSISSTPNFSYMGMLESPYNGFYGQQQQKHLLISIILVQEKNKYNMIFIVYLLSIWSNIVTLPTANIFPLPCNCTFIHEIIFKVISCFLCLHSRVVAMRRCFQGKKLWFGWFFFSPFSFNDTTVITYFIYKHIGIVSVLGFSAFTKHIVKYDRSQN